MKDNIETPEKKGYDLIEENYRILSSYLENIKSLYETFEYSEVTLSLLRKKSTQELDDFCKENGKEEKEEDGKTVYCIPVDKIRAFKRLEQKVNRSYMASELIPRSYIVSLISLYDAFIGKLLRSIYSICPEKLTSSDLTLSFSKLGGFSTIEEAQEYIIEKRIENILRGSHQDQFDVLEKELEVKTLRKFEKWPLFIEITQRRNLFVHSNGRVSSQYLSICQKEHVESIENIEKDAVLNVDRAYFENAFEVFYEIGVKLAQMVLWKLVVKKDKDLAEKSDGNLISVIYNLIVEKRYDIAIEISNFAFTAKFERNQRDTLFFLLNVAQAYKWKGDNHRCKKILDSIDTSAMSTEIVIPKLVLENKFQDAVSLMDRACKQGKQGDEMDMYRNWPIFKEFREYEGFKAKFKELYGEDIICVKNVTAGESKC